MKKDYLEYKGHQIPVYSLNTVVVGSGASGFNAADSLYQFGQKDIAIVTEGMNMGTSRNTGSDKQTYYKLSLSGNELDSIHELAKTLFNGGAKHGDIALVEAALSTKCFYKLVSIGVPFPTNSYGEYVGYKTDHDPRERATSAGPLTSKFMTERLESSVISKGIKIFDKHLVVDILTEETNGEKKAIGLIALNKEKLNTPTFGLTLFNCTNIIYATGGPSGMYEASVYPKSQTGSLGIAFKAGVKGINLTESQFGIASTKFRWNLSGTYQQVIPRYVSTNLDGTDEHEFLSQYLTPEQQFNAIFLKGYQWPFDIKKVENYGSSIIDLLVYQEIYMKGRKVFLDYTRNPQLFEIKLLKDEAYQYLTKSHALLDTPIKRLRVMNEPAYQLYFSHGIDLERDLLEINVCNQHSNGGLVGDINWESNVKHFFPVGEANGSFGVYRPGGSALNATQVGSLRAAEFIYFNYANYPKEHESFLNMAVPLLKEKLHECEQLLHNNNIHRKEVGQSLKHIKQRMSKYGAFIRNQDYIQHALLECQNDLDEWYSKLYINSEKELVQVFQYHDLLISQYTYLSSIAEYINKKGCSRGSALIHTKDGVLPISQISDEFRYVIDENDFYNYVCEVSYKHPTCQFEWKEVRPIPNENNWFENVWKAYRERVDLDATSSHNE